MQGDKPCFTKKHHIVICMFAGKKSLIPESVVCVQYGELAEVIRAGEVGNPKRDPITGTLANQHLPNSDVSKMVRTHTHSSPYVILCC